MTIKKIALVDVIDGENIIATSKITGSEAALAQFRKVADQLREEQTKKGGKQLSPKVSDFLYAHCIMMHAAEAALIDQETGNPILNSNGSPVKGAFVITKDAKGRDSVKWESPDGVLAYRNGNGDIFPEEDLVKAHKDWVGKPLCKDHVSDSIDGVRGVIVDTYYDPKFKRVHALFALDRKNYGELARKVEAGYATSVSMGTAVGRSICYECANVATVESEYCHHVQTRVAHGEVNKDLSPIELSIVVTGADPKAKILTVLAALKGYEEQVQKIASGEVDSTTLDDIKHQLDIVEAEMDASPAEDAAVKEIVSALSVLRTENVSPETRALGAKIISEKLKPLNKTVDTLSPHNREEVIRAAQGAQINLGEDAIARHLKEILGEGQGIADVDIQPGKVSREDTVENELIDTSGYGLGRPEVDLGFGSISQAPQSTLASLYVSKATQDLETTQHNLANKIASIKSQIEKLENKIEPHEENIMTFADLKKKRQERVAYWHGTEEPTPGKPQYPLMGNQDGIREKDDKQMNQDGSLGGTDGMVPGDEQTKKIQQRAELEERQARRAQWLAQIKEAGAVVELKDGKKVLVDEKTGERMADDGKSASKKKKEKEEEEDEEEDDKKKKKDDKDEKEDKKSKSKKEKDEDEEEDDDKEEKDDKKKGKKKEAYMQGTEEPTKYPLMGNQDSIREKDDKHMNQDGSLGGSDGMVPGDEQKKKQMQRVAGKLGAKLFKGADSKKSRWVFTANSKPVLTVTASEAYGEFLSDRFTNDSTYADLFHSKEWGKRVMALLKEKGLARTASELGVKVAQEPMAPAEPESVEPVADAEPAPAEEPVPAEPVDHADEDLKAKISPLVEEVEALLEKIKTEVQGPDEGVENLDVGAGEAPGMAAPEGGEELPAPGALASATAKDMLEVYAFLSDTANELCYIESRAGLESSSKFSRVAEQAIHDAKIALDHGNEVLAAYAATVKREFIKARAARREKLAKEAMGMMDYADDNCMEMKADDMDMEDVEALHELVEDEAAEEVEKHESEMHVDDNMAYDMMSAEARQKWREDLVKKAGEYDDVYEGERRSGGHKLEGLGMSVKDEGDKVEALHETHKKMMDVATKPLGKVREAAEKLDKWVREGGINPGKLDKLVSEGMIAVDSDVLSFWKENILNKDAAADAEAKSYWKQYYGQADGGAEFANGLVAEFDKRGSDKNSEEQKVRMRRAYQLGIEAQRKGVIAKSPAELDKYVDTLIELPDAQFNAMKKHIAMLKTPQGLVSAPLVGINDHESSGVEKTAGQSPNSFDSLKLIFS